MIKSSELINAYPPENLDCGVPCYMAGPDSKCELFIFDENKNCHKGSFDTTDGELQTAAEKVNMHLHRGKETLKIFKIAKNLIFAHTLTNSEKVNFVKIFCSILDSGTFFYAPTVCATFLKTRTTTKSL